MKFLCIDCDRAMEFEDRELPGDGTLAAVFRCSGCDRQMALLTNPMETQLVSSLGVKVGGRSVPEQPLETVRSGVASGRADAFGDVATAANAAPGDSAERSADDRGRPQAPVVWSVEAVERLSRVPSFVRGMVKRIYADWAKQNGVTEITPEIMDRARSDLGLEGM